MSNSISPYDRENGYSETGLALAVVLSIAFHLLVAWVFIFIFPTLLTNRERPEQYIIVDLGMGAPAAPAAPADLPVDPNQKGPDVVEAPKSPPATPQPQFTPAPEAVTAPADVIPLGPKTKAPDKPPEIKKAPPPPKITPPKVEKEKPKPKPNPDAEIEKRMAELKRKREADALDEAIAARMMNLDATRGRGDGDSSEMSGSSGNQRLHPEEARYYAHIKDIISENWVPPVESYSTNIRSVNRITIEPSGRIANTRVMESSGNQSYDISVQRAIDKSNPLPPLPPIFGGKSITPGLIFDSDELRRINRQRIRP